MDWPFSFCHLRQAGRSHIVAQGMPFLQTTLHNSIVSADGMLCVRVALCAYRIHRSVCAERKKPAIVNMISVLRTEMFDTTLLFFFCSDGLQPPSNDSLASDCKHRSAGWTAEPIFELELQQFLCLWRLDFRRLEENHQNPIVCWLSFGVGMVESWNILKHCNLMYML